MGHRSGQRETNPVVIAKGVLNGTIAWDWKRKGYYWK